MPVLLVHGFNSSAGTWNTEAQQFLATSATLPACVTTFDYGKYSTQWVTDEHVGPSLARAIVALSTQSRRSGASGKVVVVAHSMGGLAVRCAADPKCSGVAGVSDDLAGLVTFGTPNRGSFLKAHGGGFSDSFLGPVLSATCTSSLANLFGVCKEIRALLTSDASHAFTPGSSELAHLPALPSSIPVLAAAGSVKVYTSFFGLNRTYIGDAGDLVVDEASALDAANTVSGSGGKLVADCGSLDVTAPWAAAPQCWHGSETSNQQFLDDAASLISKLRNRWDAVVSGASVAVEPCATSEGSDNPPVALPPTKRSTVASVRALTYAEDTQGLVAILGPDDWSCEAEVGADGSEALRIMPGSGHPSEGVFASTTGACEGCAYDLACTLFSDGELGELANAYAESDGCPNRMPSSTHVHRINAHTIGFDTPKGVPPPGWSTPAPLPVRGFMTYNPNEDDLTLPHVLEVTCLAEPADVSICDPVMTDAISRYTQR